MVDNLIISFSKKLFFKIKTFVLILKCKKIRLSLLIDITFYTYSFLGFLSAINIAIYLNIDIKTISYVWALLFVPIIIAKITKEINKDNTLFLNRS